MKKHLMILVALMMATVCVKAQETVVLDTIYIDLPPTDVTYIKQTPMQVEGGKLMYIPDSIAGDVQKVIDGSMKIVRDDARIDLDEQVIVKGDTVPLIMKERNLGRYDRGLLNYLYIPKGQWMFGLTASYGEFNTSDLQILDLLSDLDFHGHAFSIKPSISYFIKNNLSVGLRFVYSNANAELGSLMVDIDEDMNFNIKDAKYHNESYAASLFTRHYIGLSRNSRFGVFNEIELSFASGSANFVRRYNDEPKDTRTSYMDARLNFSPGVTVFIMDNVSFNVSFGVFGFHLRNEKQSTNGESDFEEGNRFTSGASFKFNIFNINFGIGIHI